MSIIRKIIYTGLLFIAASGCVHSSPQGTQEYPTQLCHKAKQGQLDIETAPVDAPHINAYLLDCAVAVVVSKLSFQSGPHKGDRSIKKNKERIAEHFLSQTLDIAYQNEEGDNLLMSVITSFLPEQWKEKAVTILINKGINLKEKNHNGDTALDIARFKGNERIINLVSF